jgi:hypothetical protein
MTAAATETTTTTTAKKRERRVTVPVAKAEKPLSKLVARSVTKTEATKKSLAGHYRVIHGHVVLPLPRSEWTNPDGSEIPGRPKQINAELGDIVDLSHDDAENMLEYDIVEPLDAKPSRVGRVASPPPVPFRNRNA